MKSKIRNLAARSPLLRKGGVHRPGRSGRATGRRDAIAESVESWEGGDAAATPSAPSSIGTAPRG